MTPILALALHDDRPDWERALGQATTPPPGGVERRAARSDRARPDRPRRRITDDLALLRDAIDEPDAWGLRQADDEHAGLLWSPASEHPRTGDLLGACERLDARGVLEASGFSALYA